MPYSARKEYVPESFQLIRSQPLLNPKLVSVDAAFPIDMRLGSPNDGGFAVNVEFERMGRPLRRQAFRQEALTLSGRQKCHHMRSFVMRGSAVKVDRGGSIVIASRQSQKNRRNAAFLNILLQYLSFGFQALHFRLQGFQTSLFAKPSAPSVFAVALTAPLEPLVRIVISRACTE
jgi:hypothetical protein